MSQCSDDIFPVRLKIRINPPTDALDFKLPSRHAIGSILKYVSDGGTQKAD